MGFRECSLHQRPKLSTTKNVSDGFLSSCNSSKVVTSTDCSKYLPTNQRSHSVCHSVWQTGFETRPNARLEGVADLSGCQPPWQIKWPAGISLDLVSGLFFFTGVRPSILLHWPFSIQLEKFLWRKNIALGTLITENTLRWIFLTLGFQQ